MAENPHFIALTPQESYALPNPARPHGLPLAEIDLGVLADGRWMQRAAISLPDRGFSSPLGYWSDALPRLAYATRDEAFAAATGRIEEGIDHAPASRDATAIRRWLVEIEAPSQPDLFGSAA